MPAAPHARSPRPVAPATPPRAESPRRDWLILAAILLCGLLLRAAYLRELIHAPDFSVPRGDMAFHDYWARAIVTGDWKPPPGAEDPRIREVPFLRPPGYPWILAGVYQVFGLSHTAPRVVQMGLGLINVVLGFLLARGLFGRAAGLIFAALLAGYWGLIYYEGELSAPVLQVFLMLAMLLALRRWAAGFGLAAASVAGVLLGLSALTAPNMLALAPVLMLWGWFATRHRQPISPGDPRNHSAATTPNDPGSDAAEPSLRALRSASAPSAVKNPSPRHHRRAKSGAAFALAAAAVIAPVTVRNLVVADDAVLIASNGGITFFAGNHADSDGVTATLGDLYEPLGVPGWSWFNYPRIVERIAALEGRPMTYSQVSAWFTQRGLHHVRQNPGRTAQQMARKAALFWGPAEVSAEKIIDLDRQHAAVLRYGPGFSPMLALGLIGAGLAFAGRKAEPPQRFHLALLIASMIVVYFLTFLPFLVSSRFRAPIVPLVMLFAAFGIYRLAHWAIGRDWRRLAMGLGAAAVAYVAVGGPFTGEPPSAAAWHLHRGQAYHLQGDFASALREYREAQRLTPDDYLVLSNLALTLHNSGDFAAAAGPAQRCVELRPTVSGGHLLLGKTLMQLGRGEEALAALRRAIELDPRSAEAHREAAFAEARARRFDRAAGHFEQLVHLRPADAQARIWLGNALTEVGRLEEAVASYRAALASGAASADAHYGLGVALQRLGQPAAAADAFREALRIDPSHAQAARQLQALETAGREP
jgi:Flp pilus assembly protein TadD/MFS family permease